MASSFLHNPLRQKGKLLERCVKGCEADCSKEWRCATQGDGGEYLCSVVVME